MKPRAKNFYRVMCLILAALFIIPTVISLFFYN